MKKCEICGEVKELCGESQQYCDACWNSTVVPAYRHVDSLEPDFEDDIAWHGYAVREAYIAGYKAALEAGNSRNQE